MKRRITPKEFHRIREDAKLTQMELANFLHVFWRSVQRYEAGDRAIPGPVERLMELLDSDPTLYSSVMKKEGSP